MEGIRTVMSSGERRNWLHKAEKQIYRAKGNSLDRTSLRKRRKAYVISIDRAVCKLRIVCIIERARDYRKIPTFPCDAQSGNARRADKAHILGVIQLSQGKIA